MNTQYKYIVKGKVQGVGYRAYIMNKARQLQLHGYVKNLHNGDVECVIKGEVALLKSFEKIILKGPAFSKVEGFERFEDQQYIEEGFDIIY